MTGEHYSYRHYASQEVAEGFDALRFGGPIGRYLADVQAAVLREALEPLAGRTVLDVGTGTGRAAVELAAAGAAVIGLDASVEMLRVAAVRSAEAGVHLRLGRADAHALPLADRSVDAAVSLRVLMHALDWRQCVSELCRVARVRVVVDFPSSRSFARIESVGRRVARRFGRSVEDYRVISEADVSEAFARSGYRVAFVRRQFVLPIALHKKVSSLAATRGVEHALAAIGLLRLCGSPVTLVAER
ncbi:MAG TPA: class I SAM-dependent methyltransferase [Vicinamibacterales bacterium]|nr:class I SAM-dependent methyltransferase [Vicinamibacterales bacterium]